jgi:hypothetical protein
VDAAFHFTADQAFAEDLLAGRRVGLVLISAPLDEAASLEELAPPGSLPVLHRRGRAGPSQRRHPPPRSATHGQLPATSLPGNVSPNRTTV